MIVYVVKYKSETVNTFRTHQEALECVSKIPWTAYEGAPFIVENVIQEAKN